jgi:hypothetical protein
VGAGSTAGAEGRGAGAASLEAALSSTLELPARDVITNEQAATAVNLYRPLRVLILRYSGKPGGCDAGEPCLPSHA